MWENVFEGCGWVLRGVGRVLRGVGRVSRGVGRVSNGRQQSGANFAWQSKGVLD